MQNEIYRPSALILAPKRSGTNYAHRIINIGLDSTTVAVNEPLGLHGDVIGGKPNPLSPWRYSGPEHKSEKHGHTGLADDPYGAFLTKQFLGWLGQGDKLIKETDFLYLGWLLGSIPLKTVVIHRDPRDSIASFRESNLYERWRYDEKMKQFIHTIIHTPMLNQLYSGAISENTFMMLPQHQQLAFYYGVAIQEIARNIKGQEAFETTYDELVFNAETSFRQIMDFLQASWSNEIEQAIRQRTSETRDTGAHGTFRRPKDLVPFTHVFTQAEVAQIEGILSGFNIHLPKATSVFLPAKYSAKEKSTKRDTIEIHRVHRKDEIRNIQDKVILTGSNPENHLYVSETVTTNLQYAQFLQWLTDRGIPLAINGKPLFYNDLPQGTIHKIGSKIYVEKEHANHPVNFINWIGAAIYSAWIGGRLPTGKEWLSNIIESVDTIESLLKDANIGEKYGGTNDVMFFIPDRRGLYDVFGNVSIWLKDGNEKSTYEKMLAGLGWNHTPDMGYLPNPRPYWLGTSGLGVRPVFSSKGTYSSDEIFASKVEGIVELVTQHQQDDTETSARLFSIIDELFSYNQMHG